MNHTVLDSVALGYQPVWGRARQLAAVRLAVQVLHPESVDAEHLWRALGNDWPAAAPTLIIAPGTPELLDQALQGPPLRNSWLEVPHAWFELPDTLAQLVVAVRQGHQLLRAADLAAVRGEVISPLDVKSLLQLSADDALLARRQRNSAELTLSRALLPGQIYAGVADHQLASVCLDHASAWGLLGWPDEDTLHAHRERPPQCSSGVIQQILVGMETECSLERLERLVRQDPVLVYRLLALVNSAVYGLRHEIQSLRHAFMMLGFTSLARWLREQQAIHDNTRDDAQAEADLHPVRYAMVMRSRLAQHLLDPGAGDDLRAEVYLTAVFAQLDRLLHKPLGGLILKLPLSERVFDALLRDSGPYHPMLDIARVQGNPAELDALPAVCECHEIGLEHANRSLLRMLATSRDYAGEREPD
jgi:EAL and modified HD-GYP domain-containing signal transduction protein